MSGLLGAPSFELYWGPVDLRTSVAQKCASCTSVRTREQCCCIKYVVDSLEKLTNIYFRLE